MVKTYWYERWMLPLILLLSSLLRLWEIAKRDFWYDEAYTAILVRDSVHGLLTQLVQDVHPPFYFLVVKGFTSVLGQSVLSIRLVSWMFGVLGIIAVYLFAKELFNKKTAWFASFLCAISPFLIGYSQEARMYTAYGFWVVLSAYFFICTLKNDRWKDALLWGLCLGAAWLTHYMSLLFVFVFYAVFLIWQVRFDLLRKARFGQRLQFFKQFIPSAKMFVGLGLAVLLFLPWFPRFVQQFQNREDKSRWILPATFADIPHDLYIYLVGSPPGELSTGVPGPNAILGVTAASMVTVLTIGLALIVWNSLKREKRKAAVSLTLFVLFMGGVYVLSMLGKRYFISRYMLPAAYFLMVFLAAWLARLSRVRAGVALAVYLGILLLIQPTHPEEGYNDFIEHVSDYQGYHFYALNSFDYVISKAYMGDANLRIYNMGWPQYDSRSWPGIGYGTWRTEDFNVVKNDKQGLVLWNVALPLDQRNDQRFEELKGDFDLIGKYKNIEIYRPKT